MYMDGNAWATVFWFEVFIAMKVEMYITNA